MITFVFNIIISVLTVGFLIWIIISKNKLMKKIETGKGEILYTDTNTNYERVIYIFMIAFLIFVIIDIIIEKTQSVSTGIVLVNMLNVINLNNFIAKKVITTKGIGFLSYSNRLIKFIQWDSIKDAHWNKYDSNILLITYIYLDSVKDEELKFNKKEYEKIRDIVEKYIEIN